MRGLRLFCLRGGAGAVGLSVFLGLGLSSGPHLLVFSL